MANRIVSTTQVTVGAETDEVTVSEAVGNGANYGTAGGVPAAKSGNLTTRTSDTVGTLTMAAGHGITTGAILDIYWTVSGGGMRRGVTVGTVSGNDVPFSLGAGDNLPADESAITAMVPVVETTLIPNATVKGASAYSPVIGVIRFLQSNDTVLEERVFTAAGKWAWADGSGIANPFGADVAKVTFSHGQTTAADQTAKACWN